MQHRPTQSDESISFSVGFEGMGNTHSTYQISVVAQGVGADSSCHGKNAKSGGDDGK